jgi:rhamnulokinase
MRTVHCAAVDLGATSGRVIVGTWRREKLTLAEVHRFPNQFRTLSGREYWDLPYLWAEVRTGLGLARKRFPGLVSVGVDSWAVDHALLDRSGRLVHPVYAYRDSRTQALSDELGRGSFAKIYGLTGIPNYPYNTSLQLKETLAAFPRLGDSVARCLFISDYFNFLLTGRMANELSISSHSQLLDVRGMDWSPRALRHFGIPRRWFSKPRRSPAALGAIKGLPELAGVRAILVPGHDTACAFAAMPAAPDGNDLYLSSGTWSLLGFESDSPVLGDMALTGKISNERMGDGRYRPLRSSLGLWVLERTLLSYRARPGTASAWARLMSLAARVPVPKRLLDLNDPALFNPADMRAAISQQIARRGGRAPRDLARMVRLIVDSIGRAHADSVRLFEEVTGRRFRRILIVGGGSKNPLLCQATANACGIPVVSYSLEGAVTGNIASQLVALGMVRNLAQFRRRLGTQLDATHYLPKG